MPTFGFPTHVALASDGAFGGGAQATGTILQLEFKTTLTEKSGTVVPLTLSSTAPGENGLAALILHASIRSIQHCWPGRPSIRNIPAEGMSSIRTGSDCNTFVPAPTMLWEDKELPNVPLSQITVIDGRPAPSSVQVLRESLASESSVVLGGPVSGLISLNLQIR